MWEPERGRQKGIRALPKGGVVAKGTFKNFSLRARDMDQWEKAFAIKSDKLSSVSRTHIVEGENGVQQIFL